MDIGVMIIRIMIIIVLFQVSQVIYMGCLRGAGDTTYTAIASTISVTIIRTSASYFFGFVMGLGMAGIWMGILADQISRLCLNILKGVNYYEHIKYHKLQAKRFC